MTLFFSVLVILSILIWLYKLFSPSYRLKSKGDKIPGPRAWPLIGNSFVYLKNDNFLQTTVNLCKSYGPVVRIWLGKQLFIFLSEPADIEVFLSTSKHMNKGDSYRLLDSWLGPKGLLTSNEDVWKPHRKLLTPCFHFKILESSLEIMQRNANILCEQLECRADQNEFDILPYTEKCSLDIICETAMGVKLETQKSNNMTYLDSIKNITRMIVKRGFSPWLYSDRTFRLLSLGRTYYRDIKQIKHFVRQVIEERKIYLEEKVSTPNVNDKDDGQKQAKPFLDYILLESNFTDEEIENEVETFMFAGHDTTMTTIAFCVYALSKHPDVQERIYQEIHSLLGNDKQELTYEDYNELKYLNNVIKETMRLYTTVPIIARNVSEDVALPSGYILPKGSLVNFVLYRLHNTEKYFPNPDQFIPERFEKKENITNFSFIPFSAGPRNCIGQKFATLEMKAIISKLIRKYRFWPSETGQSLILEVGLILRSLNKIPVRVTLRENVTKI